MVDSVACVVLSTQFLVLNYLLIKLYLVGLDLEMKAYRPTMKACKCQVLRLFCTRQKRNNQKRENEGNGNWNVTGGELSN